MFWLFEKKRKRKKKRNFLGNFISKSSCRNIPGFSFPDIITTLIIIIIINYYYYSSLCIFRPDFLSWATLWLLDVWTAALGLIWSQSIFFFFYFYYINDNSWRGNCWLQKMTVRCWMYLYEATTLTYILVHPIKIRYKSHLSLLFWVKLGKKQQQQKQQKSPKTGSCSAERTNKLCSSVCAHSNQSHVYSTACSLNFLLLSWL